MSYYPHPNPDKTKRLDGAKMEKIREQIDSAWNMLDEHQQTLEFECLAYWKIQDMKLSLSDFMDRSI